ncbi:hypothetical protein MMC20_006554 [Loxospora ochrophaea]|nr:hypothetical protein [Loxospora ochrophaea]
MTTKAISSGNDENVAPRVPQSSRLPHPYHYQSSKAPDQKLTNGWARLPDQAQLSTATVTPFLKDKGKGRSDYFDEDGRKRRKQSTSPSESGTEADDEGASLLRLPAPPIRPRKGLKDPRGLGFDITPSPLLTPSYLDDDRHRLSLERRSRGRRRPGSRTGTDEDTRQVREKFTRKRQAELWRRASETVSLGVIGYMVFRGSNHGLFFPTESALDSSMEGYNSLRSSTLSKSLRGYFMVIGCIYLSYPIRLARRYSGSQYQNSRYRVPAAFDPAPLLYPVALPVLVALSLAPESPRFLVSNLVLSISTIPEQMIPLFDGLYGAVPWFLSLTPLLVLVGLDHHLEQKTIVHSRSTSASDGLTHELIVLLYPLHRALVPSLGFLTTTSLLPAELQLLSVAIINLLLFSSSPQAVILKGILWIGGLSLFISCKHSLKWAVAVARIPSWRFRRSKNTSLQGITVLHAVDDCLGGRLGRFNVFGVAHLSSDSDDSQDIRVRKLRSKIRPKLKTAIQEEADSPSIMNKTVPTSAIDDKLLSIEHEINAVSSLTPLQTRPQRRHTLPSYIGTAPKDVQQSASRISNRLQSLLIGPRSFVSLTSAQATVLRWIYACYTYAVVLGVIAIMIRMYVGHYALEGREPIGWALGYILGDLQAFRIWVVKQNLEKWICLPGREIDSDFAEGFADNIRRQLVGNANTRILISLYCLSIIIIGLAVVFRLSAIVEVDTRRKVFHGMMVAMFLPATFVDPPFAALALALVLAIFLLLDLFRASQLPPLSKPLTYFLAPYVDGRDHRGPVIVSHIFLLIGCAIPLWLSLAAVERRGKAPWGGWDVATRDLSMISGVVCVGLGDAAASLVGRRYGRRRWPWSGGKSLEGSLAFTAAVVGGLLAARFWLKAGGWAGATGDGWSTTLGKAVIAGCGASFTEAVLTGGNDNVIVPIILWLLVRGLKM